MSELKPLSRDAFDVMHAATNGNACLIDDPVYRQCVANILLTLVKKGVKTRGGGVIISGENLLAIATELTGAHQGEQP